MRLVIRGFQRKSKVLLASTGVDYATYLTATLALAHFTAVSWRSLLSYSKSQTVNHKNCLKTGLIPLGLFGTLVSCTHLNYILSKGSVHRPIYSLRDLRRLSSCSLNFECDLDLRSWLFKNCQRQSQKGWVCQTTLKGAARLSSPIGFTRRVLARSQAGSLD